MSKENYNLIEDMKKWRAERPDEWKMDEFIRETINLQSKLTKANKQIEELKTRDNEKRNMLEDVVNELDLSEAMIEEHGPRGTSPAELVRLVLGQKDMQIRMLKSGMRQIETT